MHVPITTHRLVAISLLSLLAGCSTSNSVFVGTYTRVGIDASQAGGGAGIGMKNLALTIAPTKEGGQPFDVVGTSDIDLAVTEFALHEVVATGPAALCATRQMTVEAARAKAREVDNKDAQAGAAPSTGPLIFVASTSFSLVDVGVGEADGAGINLGYKRTVGVRMPIRNNTLGAAYASVGINSTASDFGRAPKSAIGGVRSQYTFATGQAAVNQAKADAAALTGGTVPEGCQ